MSVLVYIESENGAFKKAALEVASYGRAVANALNTNLNAVVFNTKDCTPLGTYGVDKVLSVNHSRYMAKIAQNPALVVLFDELYSLCMLGL